LNDEPAVPTLRRELGLLDAVGIGLGAIVGAGIFVVTGVAAGMGGPALVIGLLIAGLAATANAFSSAQLAAAYPQSGATYEYGYRLLSPAAGFAAGWMFLASKISAAGTVALGLAGYLAALLPALHPRIVAVGAVVVFTLLNYFGIKRSSRANLIIVAISVGSLLVFAAAGIPSFDAANFRPFAPFGWSGVLRAAAILFFAYTGYARIATLAEEVRDPERTIPRAIKITIGGALLLYAAVAIVAVGAMGAANLAGSRAPLYTGAQSFALSGVAPVIAVGGVTAMLGVLLSQLLGLSRMTFAMARRRDLPAFLEHVHPEHGVPGRAVVMIGALCAIVAATGTLGQVAAAAAFTILVYYGIANLAALRMPRAQKLFHDAVPLFGLLACTVLAFSLSLATVLTGVAILAVGFAVRFASRAIAGDR
jgi:APA family basic amino acid/polyamine antiporter